MRTEVQNYSLQLKIERLPSFSIIRSNSGPPSNPTVRLSAVMYWEFQWGPQLVPHDAYKNVNLSDTCTPDRCCFSCLDGKILATLSTIHHGNMVPSG